MSVPITTRIKLIVATTKATQKPGINELNELETPAGTTSGILICQLCLTVKRFAEKIAILLLH
jgi:hypothetical protein